MLVAALCNVMTTNINYLTRHFLLPSIFIIILYTCTCIYYYIIIYIKSRLAIRVLNYCKPRINAKRLNDVTATEARGFITCTCIYIRPYLAK